MKFNGKRRQGSTARTCRGDLPTAAASSASGSALIFLFVSLGQPASIGFLVAAKSIFRFGELKDRGNRMEAEYITIGSLMSFGWAITTGYLT